MLIKTYPDNECRNANNVPIKNIIDKFHALSVHIKS